MDTQWRIQLLGGLAAHRTDGASARFETRKTALLLAYLAVDLGRTHSRETLAERLWPDEDWDATRDRLRQALAALRRVLEPKDVPSGSILIADRSGARLDERAVVTDVREFEAVLAAGTSSPDSSERLSRLTSAIDLYHGELLPGCDDDWVQSTRRRLAESFLGALLHLSAALVESGDLSRAIDYARRAVAADSFREESHCLLMRIYAAAGRVPDALRQYQELEEILNKELGVEPSAEARALAEQLRSGKRAAPVRAAVHFSPLVSSSSHEPSHSRATDVGAHAGAVAFLFTDVEGSAVLWSQRREAMKAALVRHEVILRHAIEANGGRVFKTMGDSFCSAFHTTREAVSAAIDAQRALLAEPWEGACTVRVRIAIHVGEAEERDGDYFGPPVNRVARLLGAGHGGQTLLSFAAADVARDSLPDGCSLRDLGQHRFHEHEPPEHVFELRHPALSGEFPPVRSLGRAHAVPSPRGSRVQVVAIAAMIVAIAGGFFIAPRLLHGPPGDSQVKSLYEDGRAEWRKRSEAGFWRALASFDEAIARDATYSRAYSGKADCYSLLAYYGYMPTDRAYVQANDAVTKAIEYPQNDNAAKAEALTSRAWIEMVNWEWTASRADFDNAIKLDKKYATAHQWYSLFLMSKRDYPGSLDQIEKAYEIDHMSSVIGKSRGQRFYYARLYPDAIKAYKDVLEAEPNSSLTHYWLGLAYIRQQDYRNAETQLAKAVNLSKTDWNNWNETEISDKLLRSEFDMYALRDSSTLYRAGLAYLYAVWPGHKLQADVRLAELEGLKRDHYVSPVSMAAIYAGLGRKDTAFDYLDKARAEHTGELILSNVDPRFYSLKEDDRFKSLLAAMKL